MNAAFLSNRYFKKFSILHYQSESILFWIETREFMQGEYVKTTGTFVPGMENLDIKEARLMRARRIVDKYVRTHIESAAWLGSFRIFLPTT